MLWMFIFYVYYYHLYYIITFIIMIKKFRWDTDCNDSFDKQTVIGFYFQLHAPVNAQRLSCMPTERFVNKNNTKHMQLSGWINVFMVVFLLAKHFSWILKNWKKMHNFFLWQQLIFNQSFWFSSPTLNRLFICNRFISKCYRLHT